MTGLEGGHGECKRFSPIPLFDGVDFGEIDRTWKVEALLIAGLTVTQAGKLFGVAKDEFDLKAGLIMLALHLHKVNS